MARTLRGLLAAATLCATLVACGGDGDGTPAALPASVAITADARAQAGTATAFSTSLASTAGITFHWDFGDGTTAEGATTTHAFATAGTYQVTLAVANSAEDLRTTTWTIQVGNYANVTGLACTQPGSGGWCWQHAIVTGQTINDVFFLDATHGWAVGEGGTILKSADGGDTWTAQASGSIGSLQHIRFYDADHGMALDYDGTALQTADGGTSWIKVTNIGGSNAPAFAAYDATQIVIDSLYGGVVQVSHDNGQSWHTSGISGSVNMAGSDCWSLYGGTVYRAANCGATATQTALPTLATNGYQSPLAVAGVSSTQGLVIGYGYDYSTGQTSMLAWSTSDGGATWSGFFPQGLAAYSYYSGLALTMSDAQNGWLTAPNGMLAYSTADGGHSWTSVAPSSALQSNFGYYAATGVTNSGILWQSSANRLSLSTDRGLTWRDLDITPEDSTQPYWTAAAALVRRASANDLLVRVDTRYYATHDGGATWVRVLGADRLDIGASYAAGWSFDAVNEKFLTSNGELLSTRDGGKTWTRQDYSTGTSAPVALHFGSATDGWMLLGGRLSHTTDGGATWNTPLLQSALSNLNGMTWGDATHGWAYTSQSLFATADGGATWTAVTLPSGSNISSAAMTGASTGVVAYYGNVLTTSDGGAHWSSSVANGVSGPLVHTVGHTVWSLSPAMRSDDDGATWTDVGLSSPGLPITGIAFTDALHGYASGSNGVLLHTVDGGTTWSAQPLGGTQGFLAVITSDTGTAWAISGNGAIASTATGGL